MIKGWSMFDAALSWLERGAELLPCQPASKRLVAGFGPYLQRITSADDARAWFEARRCNLALACGERFTVLDFDAAPQYAAWAELHPEAAASYTEITRRGVHVFFTGGGRIAEVPDGAEVKQLGGVVLLAPSAVAGFTYRALEAGAAIQPLNLAFPLLSEVEPVRTVDERGAVGDAVDTLSRVKAAWSVLELAQSVTTLGAPAGGGRWYHGACPLANHSANRDGRLPFWVDALRGLWGCYACGVRGDVVNLYAALHGLTVDQAIRAMAARV